ncbi:hypothetical protein AHAS_Ahas15G0212000 [Arachis hypogaea]
MTLACHTWLLKWHAQVKNGEWRATPLIPSGTPHVIGLLHPPWKLIPACHAHDLVLVPVVGVPHLSLQMARHSDMIGVPRHAVQVARPWICELFRLGVPCLGSQVARPSDFLELACHSFDTKWHAIVEVLLGMVSWRATPLCSSGTPMIIDGSGVPRPTWRATPSPWRATPTCMLGLLLCTLVLACHAIAFLWRLLPKRRVDDVSHHILSPEVSEVNLLSVTLEDPSPRPLVEIFSAVVAFLALLKAFMESVVFTISEKNKAAKPKLQVRKRWIDKTNKITKTKLKKIGSYPIQFEGGKDSPRTSLYRDGKAPPNSPLVHVQKPAQPHPTFPKYI